MSKAVELDVALLHVSPPDRHGYCSLGVAVETTLTAARCARIRIAQVNDQMPRTFGNTFMHISEFDAIVECSHAAAGDAARSRPPRASGDCAARSDIDRRRRLPAGRHRRHSQRDPAVL